MTIPQGAPARGTDTVGVIAVATAQDTKVVEPAAGHILERQQLSPHPSDHHAERVINTAKGQTVIDYTPRGAAAVCSLLGRTLSLCQCTAEVHQTPGERRNSFV